MTNLLRSTFIAALGLPGLLLAAENAVPVHSCADIENFLLTAHPGGLKLVSAGVTGTRRMTLEECIAYINDDELVEVTPKNVRLRKRSMDSDRSRGTSNG